jgi:hypothetical protein
LVSALANNSVSINAGIGTIAFPGFTTNGNITVASDISWASLSSLRLQANQNITINPGVKITNTSAATFPLLGSFHGQDISLDAGQSGTGVGTVTFGAGAKVDASQSYANVNIQYNPPGGYASPFDYSPFVQTTSLQSFLFASMLVNSAADLEKINGNATTYATTLAGNYTLVQSIDLSSIPNFVPIGDANHPFTGSFNGNGGNGNNNTISNLTINSTSTGPVGLFGQIGSRNADCSGSCGSGSVNNVTLTNVKIIANSASAVGALAGVNYGTISQASVSGSVSSTGSGAVGGLVGINNSNGFVCTGPCNFGISNSSANVTVTGGSGNVDVSVPISADSWARTTDRSGVRCRPAP